MDAAPVARCRAASTLRSLLLAGLGNDPRAIEGAPFLVTCRELTAGVPRMGQVHQRHRAPQSIEMHVAGCFIKKALCSLDVVEPANERDSLVT
jgi:hypothetical protein